MDRGRKTQRNRRDLKKSTLNLYELPDNCQVIKPLDSYSISPRLVLPPSLQGPRNKGPETFNHSPEPHNTEGADLGFESMPLKVFPFTPLELGTWPRPRMGWLWPGLLHPGTSGLPSGHQISRPGAESEDRELLYEEQCCMRNESRHWGREHSGDVAAVFKYLKGCHEEERLDLYWKASRGVEIKVMDGNDRQSDVSSIHERLFHQAELERWEDERSLSPGYPRTGKLTLWWQCWGRNSRIDEQEDSILLKASDGSENPILWSIYTLSDQIWLEITMQLVTLAP